MLCLRPQSSEAAQELGGQNIAQQTSTLTSGEAHANRHRYRTGTGPFMAYELLLPGEVPPHLYRYDLESFFWLLAWFCAVFDPKSHSTKRRSPWDHAELFMVGMRKHTFISNVAFYTMVFEKSDPDYRSLAHDWVRKLRRYIASAVNGHVDQMESLVDEIILARDRGDFTQAGLQLEELEALKTKAIITYEKFMGCIGVTVQVSK